MEQLPLQLSLSSEEKEEIRRRLGREPNTVEWLMLDAEWSEHCSYKSSRSVLRLLPTRGRHVLIGPGYDAGVVDVGDGYVVSIHIESHNHPSAIDPYGGAATGVGGILRDILAVGTRPIALLDALRFGDVTKSPHSAWLMRNVVKGISDYGNCVGVPTVGGEVEFDECFERNCLVDVVCIGLGRREKLILAEARDAGDLLVLVGGTTGRDGIRGATFASKKLKVGQEEDRSAVQVPDPFTEKLLMEMVLEGVEGGLIKAMKDLGAGGITCAVSEIVGKAGKGAELQLDRVPLREEDMAPEEILISESQERMLLVVEKGCYEELRRILNKYGLLYSIIGEVLDEGRVRVNWRGKVIADLPSDLLIGAPSLSLSVKEPSYLKEAKRVAKPPLPSSLEEVLLRLLGLPGIASKEWIYTQYDHEVGIRTVIKPGEADASVLKLPNRKLLAVKCDGNSKVCYLDPYWGAILILSEACSNLACVGAEPLVMVDHLQFGDPNNPQVFWSFEQCVRGLADYCRAVRVPCVGGKVSFYNEDEESGRAIKPSPVVAVMGLVRDSARPDGRPVGMALKEEGNALLVVGSTNGEMGGSEYYETIHGLIGGEVPKIRLESEKKLLKNVAKLSAQGVAKAIHDCSKGGLGVALAEMCIKADLGAEINISRLPATTSRVDELLFSEKPGRFLLEVRREDCVPLLAKLRRVGLEAALVGSVGGEELIVTYGSKRLLTVKVREMKEVWEEALPKALGDMQ